MPDTPPFFLSTAILPPCEKGVNRNQGLLHSYPMPGVAGESVVNCYHNQNHPRQCDAGDLVVENGFSSSDGYPNLMLCPLPESGFGSLGSSHVRKTSSLRVCIKNSPGPVRSTTNPSPLKTVD